MMYRTFLTSLFLLLILALPATSQIRIDVKTKWSEKKSLTVIKQGMLGAIDSSTWSTNAEFGEDYALWIKHPQRTKGKGDSLVLAVTFELRTPSLFGQGELIASRIVELRYSPRTLDSLLRGEGRSIKIEEFTEGSEMIDRILTVVGAVLPIGNPILKSLVIAVAREFNEVPEGSEIAEAILLSIKGIATLEEMIPST